PLPQPPPEEFENTVAVDTISSNPHLFQVITPINVDHFEELLHDHPNQNFIQSICCGLCEGFWPYMHTHHCDWPPTWDNSCCPLKSAEEIEFINTQVEKEIAKGCFSKDFRPNLLLGMYSMPIHAV
ncbi:hypothetical protein M404DRAFT_63218, partial [Pisolithus tinctorius Marx 270]